jgi:hypothetical protein
MERIHNRSFPEEHPPSGRRQQRQGIRAHAKGRLTEFAIACSAALSPSRAEPRRPVACARGDIKVTRASRQNKQNPSSNRQKNDDRTTTGRQHDCNVATTRPMQKQGP